MSNTFLSIFYKVFAAFNFEKKKMTAFARLAQTVNDMPQKLIKIKSTFLANRAGVK